MRLLSIFFSVLLFIKNIFATDIASLPSLIVDERVICDLRLLAAGALAPLEGFMNQKDYESVLEKMTLENGKLFPLPVVLPISPQDFESIKTASSVVLRNIYLNPLAICHVEELYEPDLDKEALATLGTNDDNHPFVKVLNSRKGCFYLAGQIEALPYLKQLDEADNVLSPADVKARIDHKKCVAFQTRNPLHKAHVALINHSLSKVSADTPLLLQPVIGPTQDGDIDSNVRKKCYNAILNEFGKRDVILTYLPLAMRMAGPKEALMHALIRKNYGATHFIVGRDHAGPSSKTKKGKSFYEPDAASNLVKKFSKKLGISVLESKEMVYVFDLDQYLPEDQLTQEHKVGRISGTKLREMLKNNDEIPDWFSYPQVLSILKKYYHKKQGVCVYLTGLSGSGKSTIASALKAKIEENPQEDREVVILDGDEIRRNLSAGLGFSRKDRSINVQRIGYAASLVVRSGGICICANIAPYAEDRLANRQLISQHGKYIEVFVNTPLDVCESRDVKGLYKLAREGKIKEFTGISDPYEIPTCCELETDLQDSLQETVEKILNLIKPRS